MTQPSTIYVLAGVNGAGKSSLGGAMFEEVGVQYYDPDKTARRIAASKPYLSQAEANSQAWHEGVRLLRRAIHERLDFAFETTLGGSTIPRLFIESAGKGVEFRIWYVGLASLELHLTRVRQRVRHGGHDIPEERIRHRYDQSRLNLIRIMPHLRSLRVFDNSFEADPERGAVPRPWLVLHLEKGRIVGPDDLARTPKWAKPIVAAALRMTR